MPLFEYRCQDCSHDFEVLVRGSEKPHCPSCNSESLEKRLSVFAAHAGGNSREMSAPGPCGACGDPRGPGACSMN
jgi:putative FmdB family regulatory protein